jgi:hypothetical protein
MKIISDYKDFYDYGMVYGVDEHLVYERFQKTLPVPKKHTTKHGGILGFCDKFFEVRYLENIHHSWVKKPFEYYESYLEYAIEDGFTETSQVVSKYDKDYIQGVYWIKPLDTIINKVWYHSYRNYDYTHWNNWLQDTFMREGVPSFFVNMDASEVTLNPNLKDIGLHKLMDAVEAFQLLSTFLPGLQPTEDFEMTDEQLGKSKGFDEYSFRNKNTKKKPKKF